MKDIHLIKATQALPFIDFLSSIGSPIDRLSHSASLPIELIHNKNAVIGEYSLWRFIELAAQHEAYDLLGYDCAQMNPVNSVGELGGYKIQIAPTLKSILDCFITDVRNESTGTNYQLYDMGDISWFQREQMFGSSRASWQVEQYIITVIIQIIRICAGYDWLPAQIKISSSRHIKPIPEEWSDIEISWGCRLTEIQIPNHILSLPPKNTIHPLDNYHADSKPSSLNIKDLIQTQILSNQVSLESAALQIGMSPKTLKRRLQYMDTSFSEIVDNLRFDIARDLLLHSTKSLHLIAEDLGYQHAPNFTRAFKRLSGLTPQQFRTKHQA